MGRGKNTPLLRLQRVQISFEFAEVRLCPERGSPTSGKCHAIENIGSVNILINRMITKQCESEIGVENHHLMRFN